MELTEVHAATDAGVPTPPAVAVSAGTTKEQYQDGDGIFISPQNEDDDGSVFSSLHALLPKVERIPWSTFLALVVWVSLPTVAYLLLFTRMGFGLHVYSYISQHLEPLAPTMAVVVGLYLMVLYLTDVMPRLHPTYIFVWSPTIRRFQQGALLIGCLGAALVVVSLAGDYPYGPITLFIVATSVWMLLVRRTFLFYDTVAGSMKKASARRFIGWCSGPFLCVSVAVFVAWFVWTFVNHHSRSWNEAEIFHVATEAAASACDPNFIDFPECQSTQEQFNNDDGAGGEVCFSADYATFTLQFPDGCDESCATNLYNDCLNPFILWVGPFLVSLCLLFLSFMATFLRTTNAATTASGDQQQQGETQQQSTSSNQLEQQQEEVRSQTDSTMMMIDEVQKDDMVRFAKVWLLLLFGMWVSASLAGAGAGLSTALAAMTLAAFVASAIFVVVSFNAMERKQHIQGLKAALEVQERENGTVYDAAKGLLLLTCTPVALLYLVVAVVKQGVRRMCGNTQVRHTGSTKALNDDGNDGIVTVEAQRLLNWAQSWDRRSRVFTFAVYWGIAFVVMNVIIAQFTLLFLSWLVEQTSQMPLGSVTAILMGVGLTMFLLPPVPGVPIYLTLGIVIIPVGRESLGLTGSIAYAMVVSTTVKLLACTIQQKLIGGLLQHHVGVRQFVGVNSKVIRSMKLILAEPGLGLAKCSVLVGGPDWPTSVLCGIMNLNLIPILVGTLPIIFLIFPTLLTGCFTYMGGLQVDGEYGQEEEFPWADTMATVCAAMTGLMQFGSMVVAAYYLEQTVSQRGDELEAMPFDEEVMAADAALEDAKKAYEEVTEWDMVPFWAKSVLSGSLTCIIVSCYMLMSLQDLCFAEYQLTYTIDEHLGGDWTALVLPLGLVAIGLFLVSVVLLLVFTTWAKVRTMITVWCTSSGGIWRAHACLRILSDFFPILCCSALSQRGAAQKVADSAEGTPYTTLT